MTKKPVKKKIVSKKVDERSRKIPPEISDLVKSRHHFECAWCGVKHTERHHILYFGKGGEHTEENLILLCPTCHTEVHSANSKISVDDLNLRKSTHLKADRFSGSLQFQIAENRIRFGMTTIEDFNHILKLGEETAIKLEKINDEYFLSCMFYSKSGDLIFWMSSNRYWTIADFSVSLGKQFIEIRSSTSDKNFLKLWQENNTLCLEGSNYYNGNVFSATIDRTVLKSGNKSIIIQGGGKIIYKGENEDDTLFSI